MLKDLPSRKLSKNSFVLLGKYSVFKKHKEPCLLTEIYFRLLQIYY